jgi:hypothetical protein
MNLYEAHLQLNPNNVNKTINHEENNNNNNKSEFNILNMIASDLLTLRSPK